MEFDDFDEYQTLRNKAMLEGALAYLYHFSESLGRDVKTMEDVQTRITEDYKDLASALGLCLKDELMLAGWCVGLFEKPKEKAETPQAKPG